MLLSLSLPLSFVLVRILRLLLLRAGNLFIYFYSFFYLQYGEVLEDAVHHVLLGQVFELVDKVDHVLAHGRTMDAVDEAAILQASVLRLDLLDHLLAERTHLCRTGDGHVLVALVPKDKR